jgi:hypothetical protein
MRVIIEVEGEGPGGPEVVLRSSRQPPGTMTTATTTMATALRGGDAIDAGPAPTPEGAASQLESTITTPALPSAFDASGGQSAGPAPSVSSES